MKWFIKISFLICTSSAFSQEDPAELSRKLTQNLTTDADKVMAIFNWITENISYSTKKGVSEYLKKDRRSELEEDDSPLLPLTERVAINMLNRKMGVCDGYARFLQLYVIMQGYVLNWS